MAVCAFFPGFQAGWRTAPAIAPAHAEGPGPATPKPARDKLLLLTDGKSHYIAVEPFVRNDDSLFYGDGKRFFAVPIQGGGAVGKERFNTTFVDPRYYIGFTQRSELAMQDGKYTVTCGKTTTPLTVVDPATARPLLAAAQFEGSPRKWQAYALARNSAGVYYYVDRGYVDRHQGDRNESRNFRLFVGPKGNLKLQKMTNVVSDSEGDVFSTATGSMRMVLGKKEPVWIQKGKTSTLLPVPVDENLAMIYTELGVYAGERLGTPCDDL
ncbi:MAG TPA: hypothetical protein PKI03_08240 [Pseudomonadota bacterium]|nr:hypothetical protein [Pseudomonadota bacterium]